MGVNLWGESPLYMNPVNKLLIWHKCQPKTKAEPSGTVRRKTERKAMRQACPGLSRGTGTAYKAESPGKSAQHDKALDSGDTVPDWIIVK